MSATGAAGALADHAARERIARDLDATLVVEAAAGTGKTTELVRRIGALLAAGRASLDRIVALTFTDAAAGELKLRLRDEIEHRRAAAGAASPEHDRLSTALPHLEQARIGTIHSFCADLLREHPVEAGIDPSFEVAAEDVARDLFQHAFDRWFERQLDRPGEGVRRVLRTPGEDGGGPRHALRRAAWALAERRDAPAPWRRARFDREAEIDALVAEIAELGSWAERGEAEDYFTRALVSLRAFAREVARREGLRPRDYDALEAALRDLHRKRFWTWSGFRSSPDDFPKAELRERRDALRARLDAFVRASGADLAPLLREDLRAVVEDYERLKERAGCLDFLDLLLRARDLLRDDAAVRAALQERFSHVFVDEFQDTDPLQAELLLLLAADDPREADWRRVRPRPGKLFLVGDPKQSIYRFRRADVALYQAVQRQVLDAGGSLVHLRTSFRSVPEIQQAVNAAFSIRMTGDGQARYVPLEPFRKGSARQPAVVALPVPRPYGDYGGIVAWRVAESCAEATAAFVEWLLRESGWRVSDRGGPEEGVPVAPRHVCLLFRRFRSGPIDVSRAYVRALEARSLPHLLVGGGAFHQREEIEAIRNALGAIERPEDEMLVYATLRGPLFAISDAALLAYRDAAGTLHPFRRPTAEAPPGARAVDEALALLRRLHLERHRRAIAETIERLLDATRAYAGIAIWPSGEQALANLGRLLDLARRAERRGTGSFRSFVERLQEEAEEGRASEAPILEEGAEGVRLMTVHRAKGLEFPVVLLVDPAARATRDHPQRWVDPERGLAALRLAGCSPAELLEHEEEEREREREEADRLAYVAATRARDLLVVATVGDAPLRDGWLDALDPSLRPPPGRGTAPETRAAPGCPPFGSDDTVLERPPRARRADRVAPGLHRPAAGDHRVVWWDPAALRLEAESPGGLRQQEILTADEGDVRSTAGAAAHERWRERRERTRAAASVPSVRLLTPSQVSAAASAAAEARAEMPASAPRARDGSAPPPATEGAAGTPLADPVRAAAERAPAVEIASAETDPRRPGGKRFGTLVHAVLATVALDAGGADVERVATLHARLLGAPEDETRAATTAARAALTHPLLRRAAAAAKEGRLRRETPISTLCEDGRILEGVIDLAFQEEEAGGLAWTVIDLKTNAELGPRIEGYRRQVALYALALERATGLAARAVLLRI